MTEINKPCLKCSSLEAELAEAQDIIKQLESPDLFDEYEKEQIRVMRTERDTLRQELDAANTELGKTLSQREAYKAGMEADRR